MVGETAYERDVLPYVLPFSEALSRSVSARDRVGVDHFDHGSGTGEVLRALGTPATARRVVALEPNGAMAERFRELYGRCTTVELFVGTLDDYVDESVASAFDLITSQLVLPFVRDPFDEL